MNIKNKQSFIERYPSLERWLKELSNDDFMRCKFKKMPQGQFIFRTEDELQSIYLLSEGSVMISSGNLNGNEMGVFYINEGDMLGEIEAILQIKYMKYNAIAFTDCAMLEMPLILFQNWITSNRVVAQNLNKMFAEKLYLSSNTTVMYNQLPTESRFKLFLLRRGCGIVKDSREQIAASCGISVRTVYRLLAEMKKKGELSIEKKKIQLTSDHLKKIETSLAQVL